MSRELKRLKKSSSNWLNSGNALIQRVKTAIFVFPVLPGSTEAEIICGGIVKRLLISDFIGNISVKKISKSVHVCVKISANQRWYVFETWRSRTILFQKFKNARNFNVSH